MDDMAERGLLRKYYEELGCLFFRQGLSLSIRMAIQKGYTLTKEELRFLVSMVLRQFPNIRENRYVRRDAEGSAWVKLMVTLLDLDFTDECVQAVNEIMRKYI